MWNSFKRSAKKFRSRSREKLGRKRPGDDSRLSHSQPDISNSEGQSPGVEGHHDFESLFDSAERRHHDVDRLDNGERSFSDPSMLQNGDTTTSSFDRSRMDEKESEVDSGIAVVEHSVSWTNFTNVKTFLGRFHLIFVGEGW